MEYRKRREILTMFLRKRLGLLDFGNVYMSCFKSKEFFDSAIALLKNKWLPFVLGIPLFFCLHHYEGIVGDARLYLLQVIHSWFPERFVNDPPFMFGNQDSYSIFSLFYGFVLDIFPVDSGTMFFTLWGQCLWLLAAFYFIYQFSRRLKIRLWFTPLVLCFIVYSGHLMPNDHISFWTIVESFNASRLYSVAIAIWGLGFLIADKKYISLVTFLFGTTIHPLTAGWCLPLWLFLYYPKARFPIAAVSALLPLTFLLHKGVFDIYPEDWGNCTHDHPVKFLMLWRETLAVIFFGVFVPKFTRNEKLLKLTKSAFGVLLIGFYWSATGGVAKHILIYQVQTWRVEWLFFILAMPIFAYLVHEQVRLLLHEQEKILTSRHIALLLMGFAMFMPAPCSVAALGAIILLCVSEKRWNQECSMIFLSILCVLSAAAQELANAILSGIIRFPLTNWTNLFKEIDNCFVLQLSCIVGIFAQCVYKAMIKKIDVGLSWGLVIALLLYVVFPQFQLLPVTLTVFAFSLSKKIRMRYFVLFLLLLLGDSLFCTEYRQTNILIGIPKVFLNSFVSAIPVIIVIVVFFINVSNGMRRTALVMCLVVLITNAVIGYDKRSVSLREAEANIELFKKNTIFPQIKNRGKMLYHVSGEYVHDSRMQFLTGSYFAESTPVGEPLFQGQFNEERKRINYILYKELRGYIAKKGDWEHFVKDSLSRRDILYDRFAFLCSINEVSHIVSSIPMPNLESKDVYNMDDYKTIYLYGCPNAKD